MSEDLTSISEHHIPVNRTARYFTLGSPTASLRQVWFVCHGYGQLAQFFLRSFRRLDDGTRLIVAPEALSRFYLESTGGRVGATWMTREDRLNEIQDYIAYLNTLSGKIISQVDVNKIRLNILGFSQGTATVMRWVCDGKVKPDQVILWAGGIPPEIDLALYRNLFRQCSLKLVIGEQDEYITPAMVQETEERLKSSGISYRLITFNGRHQLNGEILEQLASVEFSGED